MTMNVVLVSCFISTIHTEVPYPNVSTDIQATTTNSVEQSDDEQEPAFIQTAEETHSNHEETDDEQEPAFIPTVEENHSNHEETDTTVNRPIQATTTSNDEQSDDEQEAAFIPTVEENHSNHEETEKKKSPPVRKKQITLTAEVHNAFNDDPMTIPAKQIVSLSGDHCKDHQLSNHTAHTGDKKLAARQVMDKQLSTRYKHLEDDKVKTLYNSYIKDKKSAVCDNDDRSSCTASTCRTTIRKRRLQVKRNLFEDKKAPPVITADNKDNSTQYGKFGKSTKLYVNVYSIPNYFGISWYIGNTKLVSNKYATNDEPAIIQDVFQGVAVQLDGYRVTLTIHDLQEVDFTNYTLRLYHGIQDVYHEVTLESAKAQTSSNATIGSVAGVVVALLIVVAIIISILIFKKRKAGIKQTEKNTGFYENSGFQNVQMGDEYEDVVSKSDIQQKQTSKTYESLGTKDAIDVYDHLDNRKGLPSSKPSVDHYETLGANDKPNFYEELENRQGQTEKVYVNEAF